MGGTRATGRLNPRPSHGPTMVSQLTHYFSALVFLVALSVVYQNVASPMMRPPTFESIAMKESTTLRVDQSLQDLFAEGQWQRGTCKQLQTSQGMLLFENWEQTSNDHWKLWPITVVIGRGLGGSDQQDPVIIDAPQGAELKFTGSLDVMSGDAPPIQWGRMVGNVHIYRSFGDVSADENSRERGGKPRRSFDLRTSEVGIDSRRIWTTETINIAFGEAHMIGRDLTIHLAGSASPGGPSPASLDRMELIYLDELVMPMKGGRLAAGQSTTSNQSEENSTISIGCGGRVEYDFALDQLLLRDSVSLVHQTASGQIDRFDCGQLDLTLNDPANDSIVRKSPLDWMIKLVATGNRETGRPAIAKLPSMDAEIAADQIVFNAVKGLISAEGERGIQIRRGGVTARLSNLTYQFNPKNPAAIGMLNASGAGIVTITDPNIPIRKAQWLNGIRMTPLAESTAKDLDSDVEVWIDGEVSASLVDGGEFTADLVGILLTPQQTTDGRVVDDRDDRQRKTLVPLWFKGIGDVRIETTAIAAETKQLWLNFISEENPRASEDLASSGGTDGDGNAGGNSALRQWVAQPGANPTLVDPVARPRPLIRGESINAQLRRNSSGLSAKQLSVVGNVEVEHAIETGGQSLPARLTGQRLELIDGGGEDVLQLSSNPETPARFELGDGFFVGPQIQIRPSDNMVWINAAGEFQIPTAALPKGLTVQSANAASTSGGGVTWIKPPHCRWQGEMLFDGRKAVLSEGVDIHATLLSNREAWELKLSGDRLEVDLLEPVQMRDITSVRSAVIQKITMMQSTNRPVIATALHRAPDGVLEAKHLIHARSLTMAPGDGGRLIGAGPGWYRGWTTGNPMDASASNSDTKQRDALIADATLIDGAARELTGIHLTFNDSMQADLSAQNLDFLRGVRVGVQSVTSWDQSFDAAKMDSISNGQSTLDCDRLRFSFEPSQSQIGFGADSRYASRSSTAWEMEAVSGVVFRSRGERGLVEGTASRAAYSSSKDVFTIEGPPSRPAIFRQTQPDGQPGPEVAVYSLRIRPKTMTVENGEFARFNIAAPPNFQK